jgi:flagellar biogenesis protein FliO
MFLLLCGSGVAVGRAEPAPAPSLPHTTLGEEPVRATSVAPSGGSALPPVSGQPQGMDYPRVLAALGMVIALIMALRWGSRFVFPAVAGRTGSRAIEVVSRSALAPKQQVVLLRVGRRLVVVGDSGSQLHPLCEITDPDEVAELIGQLRGERSSPGSRGFGAMFGRSRQSFEPAEDPPADATQELRDAEPDEAPVASAREELNGLRERVRLLAEQFKS